MSSIDKKSNIKYHAYMLSAVRTFYKNECFCVFDQYYHYWIDVEQILDFPKNQRFLTFIRLDFYNQKLRTIQDAFLFHANQYDPQLNLLNVNCDTSERISSNEFVISWNNDDSKSIHKLRFPICINFASGMSNHLGVDHAASTYRLVIRTYLNTWHINNLLESVYVNVVCLSEKCRMRNLIFNKCVKQFQDTLLEPINQLQKENNILSEFFENKFSLQYYQFEYNEEELKFFTLLKSSLFNPIFDVKLEKPIDSVNNLYNIEKYQNFRITIKQLMKFDYQIEIIFRLRLFPIPLLSHKETFLNNFIRKKHHRKLFECTKYNFKQGELIHDHNSMTRLKFGIKTAQTFSADFCINFDNTDFCQSEDSLTIPNMFTIVVDICKKDQFCPLHNCIFQFKVD